VIIRRGRCPLFGSHHTDFQPPMAAFRITETLDWQARFLRPCMESAPVFNLTTSRHLDYSSLDCPWITVVTEDVCLACCLLSLRQYLHCMRARSSPQQMLVHNVMALFKQPPCGYRVSLANTNASTSTLYMTEDFGNGTYRLTARLTAAAVYDARLFVGGALASRGTARRFLVAPGPAHPPLCVLNNVESTGVTRGGSLAFVTVRRLRCVWAVLTEKCLHFRGPPTQNRPNSASIHPRLLLLTSAALFARLLRQMSTYARTVDDMVDMVSSKGCRPQHMHRDRPANRESWHSAYNA
jgi:hypothetical protein